MLKNISCLAFIICSLSLSAQIDTSFYPAEYPDGMIGLVVDVEQKAELSLEEKYRISQSEIEILLIINLLGDVINTKVFAEDYDSTFVDKLSRATLQLKRFQPASYNGNPVDSYFNFKLKYKDFDFSESPLISNEKLDFEILDRGFRASIGVKSGIFSGNINRHYSYAAGVDFGLAINHANWIFGLDGGLLYGKQENAYALPMNVIMPSNNMMAFFGIKMGRNFDLDRFSFEPQMTLKYALLNIGVDEQNKLYRHKGIVPGMEFNFLIPINEGNVIPYYYDQRYSNSYINVFVTGQYLLMDDQQSDGFLIGGGLRYLFQIRKLKS